ncbi:hypothetical protein [Nostoc sp. FACHB-280]|nr:hypothetical protein [Nostoc sp. FACHB-280]
MPLGNYRKKKQEVDRYGQDCESTLQGDRPPHHRMLNYNSLTL